MTTLIFTSVEATTDTIGRDRHSYWPVVCRPTLGGSSSSDAQQTIEQGARRRETENPLPCGPTLDQAGLGGRDAESAPPPLPSRLVSAARLTIQPNERKV
jgi:hypothetical protein